MSPAGNYTFEPRRPRDEEPYKIAKESDPRFSNSWKTTANVKKGDTYKSVEGYFNEISNKADKFRKKAYKGMQKSKKNKQKVPKGPKF